jgi:hypothetical protein
MSLLLALQAGWLEMLMAGVAALTLVRSDNIIAVTYSVANWSRKPQVVIGTVCYRLTLHPLAKYPGPVLAGLTDWVGTYQTVDGDRHYIQLADHKKYGTSQITCATVSN